MTLSQSGTLQAMELTGLSPGTQYSVTIDGAKPQAAAPKACSDRDWQLHGLHTTAGPQSVGVCLCCQAMFRTISTDAPSALTIAVVSCNKATLHVVCLQAVGSCSDCSAVQVYFDSSGRSDLWQAPCLHHPRMGPYLTHVSSPHNHQSVLSVLPEATAPQDLAKKGLHGEATAN